MRHASCEDASRHDSTVVVNSSPPYDSEITDIDIDPFLVEFHSSQSIPLRTFSMDDAPSLPAPGNASFMNPYIEPTDSYSRSQPTIFNHFELPRTEIYTTPVGSLSIPDPVSKNVAPPVKAAGTKKTKTGVLPKDIFRAFEPHANKCSKTEKAALPSTQTLSAPSNFLESDFYTLSSKTKSAKDILCAATASTQAAISAKPTIETAGDSSLTFSLDVKQPDLKNGNPISRQDVFKTLGLKGPRDAVDAVNVEDSQNALTVKEITSSLEDKIYGLSAKRTNPRDIFLSLQRKELSASDSPTPITRVPENESPFGISQGSLSESANASAETPILVDLSEDDASADVPPTATNEKRMTAQDILMASRLGLGPLKDNKKGRVSSDRASFKVILKLLRDSLQTLKDYDSPFRTRGNKMTSGQSTDGKPTSFFDERPKAMRTGCLQTLMTAPHAARSSPLLKLKRLEPPVIPREQMHIYPSCGLEPNPAIFHLSINRRAPHTTPASPALHPLLSLPRNDNMFREFVYTVTQLDKPPQQTSQTKPNPENLLWTELFLPRTKSDLLVLPAIATQISNWIDFAFINLKQYNAKDPRNVVLARQRKKRQLKAAASQGFVMPDWILDDDEEEEEDTFVPILILQGRTGLCKSLSIYCIMHERGGYVHEINTSSERSRREVYSGLKEFCTSQIVHHRHQREEFQEGLVLLEDVNILFELDKTFWTAVSDILNITRCPIVLTCETLRNIPKAILDICSEQNSIVRFDENPVPKHVVSDYVAQCAMTQGYKVSNRVLDKILPAQSFDEQYDLRKALMECQAICAGCEVDTNELVEVDIIQPDRPPTKLHSTDLKTIASTLDHFSIGDVISCSSSTPIPHAIIPPELIDIPAIDESLLLRQPLQEFEIDLGREIQLLVEPILGQEHARFGDSQPWFAHNQPRDTAIAFLGSRSRFCVSPMRLQSLRRSARSSSSTLDSEDSVRSDQGIPTVGVPEDSVLYRLSPTDIMLDVLPYCRQWYYFQLALDKIEADALANDQHSVKHFLRYRNFQNMSSAIIDTIPGYIS